MKTLTNDTGCNSSQPMNNFHPPLMLRNAHVQSILNSIRLRRPLVIRRSKEMLKTAVPHILDCGDGIRLMGYHSGHNPAPPGKKDLCILIHGWEGSSDSSYIVSTAGFLWNQGMDIFRLNMRDHGPSHHLNEGLFHSCRIDEVVGAVKQIATRFPHKRLLLAGFSLGGNFALRVAVGAPKAEIPLNQVVAICPVLYPPGTLIAMEAGLQIYHLYFMKKWRRSLAIKRQFFPHIKALQRIAEFKTISQMTDYFVRHCTEYPDLQTYLKGYAITGDRLSALTIPSTIIASNDDPVIPAADLKHLARPACLHIETTKYGGHCGYLQDYRLTSWADQRIMQLFSSDVQRRSV
ncbi:MAG: alpha/beta fold hydrolase [Desulfobacteraceae bacterium]|nr:MAG: alpha/beta fold hydrolase [Desulfobacteraceae bacterium]